MKTFTEWTQTQITGETHPFHGIATSLGYQHTQTHNNLGASVHSYTHPSGHSLQLKTGSGGDNHTFTHTSKSGRVTSGDNKFGLSSAMLSAT